MGVEDGVDFVEDFVKVGVDGVEFCIETFVGSVKSIVKTVQTAVKWLPKIWSASNIFVASSQVNLVVAAMGVVAVLRPRWRSNGGRFDDGAVSGP